MFMNVYMLIYGSLDVICSYIWLFRYDRCEPNRMIEERSYRASFMTTNNGRYAFTVILATTYRERRFAVN